jgi:hypothetical protein
MVREPDARLDHRNIWKALIRHRRQPNTGSSHSQIIKWKGSMELSLYEDLRHVQKKYKYYTLLNCIAVIPHVNFSISYLTSRSLWQNRPFLYLQPLFVHPIMSNAMTILFICGFPVFIMTTLQVLSLKWKKQDGSQHTITTVTMWFRIYDLLNIVIFNSLLLVTTTSKWRSYFILSLSYRLISSSAI